MARDSTRPGSKVYASEQDDMRNLPLHQVWWGRLLDGRDIIIDARSGLPMSFGLGPPGMGRDTTCREEPKSRNPRGVAWRCLEMLDIA